MLGTHVGTLEHRHAPCLWKPSSCLQCIYSFLKDLGSCLVLHSLLPNSNTITNTSYYSPEYVAWPRY